MKKSIMIILINHRRRGSVEVQKVLAEWGCIIKTRLGIHEGVLDQCSDEGLIILELVGDDSQREKLKEHLNQIDGVKAKLVVVEM